MHHLSLSKCECKNVNVEERVDHVSDRWGDCGSYCLQDVGFGGVQWACNLVIHCCVNKYGQQGVRRVRAGSRMAARWTRRLHREITPDGSNFVHEE